MTLMSMEMCLLYDYRTLWKFVELQLDEEICFLRYVFYQSFYNLSVIRWKHDHAKFWTFIRWIMPLIKTKFNVVNITYRNFINTVYINTLFIYVTDIMYSTVLKSQFKQVAQISFQHLLCRIYCLHDRNYYYADLWVKQEACSIYLSAFLNVFTTRYILIYCSMWTMWAMLRKTVHIEMHYVFFVSLF